MIYYVHDIFSPNKKYNVYESLLFHVRIKKLQSIEPNINLINTYKSNS